MLHRGTIAYPKVNLQVSTATEFPVADLESDCHLVVLVKRFVEAFALVCLHLDVVRQRVLQQAARCSEKGKRREPHACRSRDCCSILSRGGISVVPSDIHGDASCCPQCDAIGKTSAASETTTLFVTSAKPVLVIVHNHLVYQKVSFQYLN